MLENISIILVNPQMGENIGSAARGMLNFGLTDLRIVNPRDGWPNQKAIELSKGAKSVVENAIIYDSLSDSCHDISKLYATTARKRDMNKEVIALPDLPKEISQSSGKTAIIFGCEKSGLTNKDISIADAIISIPVCENYSSLNLAQAVNVVCYQLLSSKLKSVQAITENLATKKETSNFCNKLVEDLKKNHFFKVEEKKESMILNINNIFSRSNLTRQEINILHGIIKSLTSKN